MDIHFLTSEQVGVPGKSLTSHIHRVLPTNDSAVTIGLEAGWNPQTHRMWKQRESICFCHDSNLGYPVRILVTILTDLSRVPVFIWYVYVWSLFDCTLRNHTASNDCKMVNNEIEMRRSWRNLRWKSWSLSGRAEENHQNPLPGPRQKLEPDTPPNIIHDVAG